MNSICAVPVYKRELRVFTCFVFATLALVSSVIAQQASPDLRTNAIASLVKEYCVDCHRGKDAEAGFDLTRFDSTIESSLDGAGADPSLVGMLEKMTKRLRARQMPPVDAIRPVETQYTESLASLESVLDESASKHPRTGRLDAVRRLNRTEYRNSIRDLLAIDVDVNSLFPADESGHGFDNVTLGELPPVLLSRYVTAAEQISRLAVGRATSPSGVTVRLPPDRTQDSHVEGLPLGTRGGTVFSHQFPASGDYELQVRLTRDRDEHLEGLNGSHDIDVLLDRAVIHQFTVEPSKNKALGTGYERDDSLIDANLKHRFRASAGPHWIGVTFPNKNASLSVNKRQPFDASFNRHRHPRQSPAIFEVSIVGPLEPESSRERVAIAEASHLRTPSQRKIFTSLPSKPDDAYSCAEQILSRLMRLAYRRPVVERDLQVPMKFFGEHFDAQKDHSDAFEQGIEAALTTVLVNPHFLFRVEQQPQDAIPGSTYRISDLELASRLSFFLWSSIPDDELLQLAQQNQLRAPETLRKQVMRMLGDDRSQSLVTNFASQWLYLRNLDSFRPDMRLFPDFDDNLRVSLRRETELLFENVLREDRSVVDLIRTRTTYLNERLATHYGIPNVYGSHFRPVPLPDSDDHRGGLLRHGSILAVTSYSTRTSPTVRGNWILGNILGTPPPPPPPNVPSLKDKAETTVMTIRERLAEHRANAACASCHDLMDPVGFAFENFDAVGRWREFDDGQAIDASGDLPDGTPIKDFEELEASILARPELFVGTLTEKLLTFAIGRGIEPWDGAAVRKILRDTSAEDYQFSSLIVGVVSSVPFQMRMGE